MSSPEGNGAARSPRLANFTRKSASIPRKLLRRGALHLLAVYHLVRLSDLGREGIENSGSYRFADHVYRNVPSGRTLLGRWIDRLLLGMPATRAFRRRYLNATAALRRALESFPADVAPLRVLAVPCGLPRDLVDLARVLERENPALLQRIAYHGMDLDPVLLERARAFTSECPVSSIRFSHSDALRTADYPPAKFHAVVSTGLGEFLNTDDLRTLLRNVHGVLAEGGTFYTSATDRDPRSDALMRLAELTVQYRSRETIEALLGELPWRRLSCEPDSTGLQTFVTAVK